MAMMWIIHQPIRRKRKGSGNCTALTSFVLAFCDRRNKPAAIAKRTKRKPLRAGAPSSEGFLSMRRAARGRATRVPSHSPATPPQPTIVSLASKRLSR